MPCTSCQSLNQSEFDTEMCFHFPGLENVEKSLFLYPKVTVCLDCGLTKFSISQTELLCFAGSDFIVQGRQGFLARARGTVQAAKNGRY